MTSFSFCYDLVLVLCGPMSCHPGNQAGQAAVTSPSPRNVMSYLVSRLVKNVGSVIVG